ncbi:hypothetical protein NCS52_00391300 [Fusarium sp. LHS14.1]|nr:hypothetical protein NCS52_00391300 [Fusarium sp. LHS14.1]
MSASRSSQSRKTKSTDPASTLPTPTTTRKSTPYDRNFDLHLTENAIHPTWKSRKPDLEEIRATLIVSRSSLSLSNFSDGAFKAFQKRNDQAKDENDVLANVIPTVLGPSQADRNCARNTLFANLDPLTDGTIAAPKPDIYFGAYPDQLARSARNQLAGHIVPSTMEDKPMAPNFFLEVKGPDGKPSVATRQARYNGAIGSRGIHSLQNYGAEEPEYDGKAYTFSSTYLDGTLKLHAHHVTAPTTEGGRPEYHMTHVKSYAMASDLDTFVEGAGALRNMLDFAEQRRDDFVRAANARASQLETVAIQERTTAKIQPREDSADGLVLSPPRDLDKGHDSQDPSAIDPPTTLTTSFASSSGLDKGRPKLRRSPRNRGKAGSSTTVTGPEVASRGKSL